jgi:hypothetical protein
MTVEAETLLMFAAVAVSATWAIDGLHCLMIRLFGEETD